MNFVSDLHINLGAKRPSPPTRLKEDGLRFELKSFDLKARVCRCAHGAEPILQHTVDCE